MANLINAITNTIKHWYVPLIFGIIFLVAGIYIFTVPLEAYVTLSVLFSISFISSGLLEIFFSINNSKTLSGWGWYLVGGLLTLGMGVYLMVYPAISMAMLPFVVGFTVLFRSIQLLGFALDLKELGILKWGNLAVASVLGIVFSFLLLANPIFSGMSLVVVTALSFIFSGIASIVLAFNLKKVKDFPETLDNELKSKIEKLKEEIKTTTK